MHSYTQRNNTIHSHSSMTQHSHTAHLHSALTDTAHSHNALIQSSVAGPPEIKDKSQTSLDSVVRFVHVAVDKLPFLIEHSRNSKFQSSGTTIAICGSARELYHSCRSQRRLVLSIHASTVNPTDSNAPVCLRF